MVISAIKHQAYSVFSNPVSLLKKGAFCCKQAQAISRLAFTKIPQGLKEASKELGMTLGLIEFLQACSCDEKLTWDRKGLKTALGNAVTVLSLGSAALSCMSSPIEECSIFSTLATTLQLSATSLILAKSVLSCVSTIQKATDSKQDKGTFFNKMSSSLVRQSLYATASLIKNLSGVCFLGVSEEYVKFMASFASVVNIDVMWSKTKD